MEIRVNLETLAQEYITPDDYVFLWGLFTGYDLTAVEMYPNYKQLEEKGFIKISEDYILTAQGRGLFEVKGIEAQFIEFWTSYPLKSGQRALRASSADSKNGRECLDKYKRILQKKPYLHPTIMKGLENYVKSTDSRFLKAIEVFLNQEVWDKYTDNIEIAGETGTTQSI